jgi:hypothetical protein
MGLFPAVLDEAKHKGIDLAPKTIPPEVFDKRAVEKDQARFRDVAYIEVTPRFDKKDKLAVAVELTDFRQRHHDPHLHFYRRTGIIPPDSASGCYSHVRKTMDALGAGPGSRRPVVLP